MFLSVNGMDENYKLSGINCQSVLLFPWLESLLLILSINITKEINSESVSIALLYFSLVERIIAMFDLERGRKDKAGKVSTVYGSTQPTDISSIKASASLFYVLLQGQLSSYSLIKSNM